MPDDNNNCPSCNDYPMGEPLPGNPNVLVRPYAPPTDAELEFSKNFYAGMRARTGHYPGAGIPARARDELAAATPMYAEPPAPFSGPPTADTRPPVPGAKWSEQYQGWLMPDASGLPVEPQGTAVLPRRFGVPDTAVSHLIRRAMSGEDVLMPSQITAPWTDAETLHFSGQIKTVADMPDDEVADAGDALRRIYEEWERKKADGEPFLELETGEDQQDSDVPILVPGDFEILPVDAHGNGCTGEKVMRRFRRDGYVRFEITRWLVGGYTRYARGSPRTREDELLDEQRQQAKLADSDVVPGEPETVGSLYRKKTKDIQDECKELGDWTINERDEVRRRQEAQTFRFVMMGLGLPQSLLDPIIQGYLYGFICPEHCKLAYELSVRRFDAKAYSDRFKATCDHEVVGTEIVEESRGVDARGRPVRVTITLEQVAVFHRVSMEFYYDLDALLSIHCTPA